MPEEEPTVMWVLLLLHVPPVAPSVSVIDEPIHTDVLPEMGGTAGTGLTVTGIVVKLVQPEVIVYLIVTTPGLTLCTTPPVVTVAMAVLLLLHTCKPPVAPSTNVVVDPAQTVMVPVMVPADGSAFTVIATVSVAIPQLLVTL
jgi:hypothetical protein